MKETTKKILTIFGFERAVHNVNLGNCPLCEHLINQKEFRGPKDYREFQVLGLCQKCQDEIFNREPEIEEKVI